MAKHLGPSRPAEPGIGWWNDLWVMTADGRRFWQLTHYNPRGATAVLMPRFSRDGTKVAWTELIAGPRDRKMATGPFGRWQLHIAEFAMDSGVPSLRNIQSLAPGGGIFYEFQDWSPSGANILFAADIGLPSPYVLDLFDLNLKTGELRNLTNSSDQWDEQGTYSPSGRKIVYMSSRNNPEFNPKSIKSLRAEDFLMDSDGRNNVQLTHFNTPGSPENAGEQSAATKAAWSPDGSRLLLEQLMMGRSYQTKERSRFHLLTFAGACGAR
jgi:Tol biopolymer transport system component